MTTFCKVIYTQPCDLHNKDFTAFDTFSILYLKQRHVETQQIILLEANESNAFKTTFYAVLIDVLFRTPLLEGQQKYYSNVKMTRVMRNKLLCMIVSSPVMRPSKSKKVGFSVILHHLLIFILNQKGQQHKFKMRIGLILKAQSIKGGVYCCQQHSES